MSVKPNKAPAKDEKSDKPDAKPDAKSEKREATPFVNEPSGLDETTHRELSMMHNESAHAVLFAKSIQWRSVGAALLVDGAFVAMALFTAADKPFVDLLKIFSIVLACGVIFVLVMYQFWQVNEINKINAIDRHLSTLYLRIARLKSRREGNIHRYTILLFMIAVVVLGVVVVSVGIDQAVLMHKPAY